MASDTDHTCCPHSPIPVGASHCVNRDVPDYPRGDAITRERRGVEKALCSLPHRTICVRLDCSGLCRSDGYPCMATSHRGDRDRTPPRRWHPAADSLRSEEHTSELQSLRHLVCRLLLE